MAAGFPQSPQSREQGGSTVSFMTASQRPHTLIPSVSCWLHSSPLSRGGRDYVRPRAPGRRKHWECSYELAAMGVLLQAGCFTVRWVKPGGGFLRSSLLSPGPFAALCLPEGSLALPSSLPLPSFGSWKLSSLSLFRVLSDKQVAQSVGPVGR